MGIQITCRMSKVPPLPLLRCIFLVSTTSPHSKATHDSSGSQASLSSIASLRDVSHAALCNAGRLEPQDQNKGFVLR
jgi:hypothetical protein